MCPPHSTNNIWKQKKSPVLRAGAPGIFIMGDADQPTMSATIQGRAYAKAMLVRNETQ